MARTSKASKKSTGSKKSAAKSSATGKTTKRAGTKTTATKSSAAKKAATKKTTAKKAPVKKTTAKKSASKAASKKAAEKAAPTGTTKKTASKTTAKAAKKAPRKKTKSPFDSKFLERQRRALISERETYDRQATLLKAEADSLVADIDPGDVQFDEESGEGDTIAVERNRDLALSARAREMIDEIDHALGKFEHGTYGICEVSDEPIPRERLEALPWAREKVEYKVGGFGRR